MKDKIIRITGIALMTIGAVILTASIAVNVMQNINKNKAIREFEKLKSGYIEGDFDGENGDPYSSKSEDEGSKSSANPSKSVEVPENDADSKRSEGLIDSESMKAASSTGYLVRIPKIDCTEPVKEGVDRYALAAALGHEPKTVLPGETGNCVIAGHRNYNFGKYFNRLDEVEIGDTIYVDTVDDTYEYIVEEIKVVEPTDLSVLENTEEEILTLYTCTPIYIATHRLVIIAKRVNF